MGDANYGDPNNGITNYQDGAQSAPELPSSGAPTPVQGDASQQPAAPAATPAQPFWKTLLQGALNGLAGGAGAHNWGQALGGGVKGVVDEKQREFNNEQTAQQNASNIKFRDLNSALIAGQLSHQATVFDQNDAAANDAHDKSTALVLKTLFPNTTFDYVPGSSVADAMGQETELNGGVGIDGPVFQLSHGLLRGNTSSQSAMQDMVDSANAYRGMFGIPGDAAVEINGPRATSATRAKAMHDMQSFVQGFNVADGKSFTTAEGYHAAIQQNRDMLNALQDDDNTLSTPKGIKQLTMLQQREAKLESGFAGFQQGKTDDINNAVAKDNALMPNRMTMANYRNALSARLKQIPSWKDKQESAMWIPGATADEKKKATLGENVAVNSDAIVRDVAANPNLVGAVGGRFTTIQQMIGSNDPAIARIGNDLHNIAMANVGIHGMRSQEAVAETERTILNKWKSGPDAIKAALQSNMDSVQSFIDDARPENFPTHSSQGGASGFFAKGYTSPQTASHKSSAAPPAAKPTQSAAAPQQGGYVAPWNKK